jgi:hypothetical protein
MNAKLKMQNAKLMEQAFPPMVKTRALKTRVTQSELLGTSLFFLLRRTPSVPGENEMQNVKCKMQNGLQFTFAFVFISNLV